MLIKSKGEKAFDIFNIFLMILLTVMFVYPAILIVCASFTSANMLTKYGYSVIIREFSLSSYKYIFTAQDLFLRAMGNSLFMTALGTFSSSSRLLCTPTPFPEKSWCSKSFS